MTTESWPASLTVVERPANDRRFACGCCHSSDDVQPSVPTQSAGYFRRSASGGVLTLLGMLGWVLVPKCPLCLAAYLAVGSGITLSFAQSQVLHRLLLAVVAGLILAGAWQLGRWGRQLLQSRGAANGKRD